MNDTHILDDIAYATGRETTPRVAGCYHQTDGPTIVVFDCPVPIPDEHRHAHGVLFIAIDRPPSALVECRPAGITDRGAVFVGRPLGHALGISNISADDAAAHARRELGR